jgi:hypothetical protein
MATGLNVLHAGGEGTGPTVGTTSVPILPRQDGWTNGPAGDPRRYRRAYALIQADIDNTAKVFLRLQNEGTAVAFTGICLNPGDAYEITHGNLYQGEVHAVAVSGTQQLYIQLGN